MPLRILSPSLLVMLLLTSCNDKEIARLEMENDSLRNLLDFDHRVVNSVRDIQELLDSIDHGRKLMVHRSAERLTAHDISSRLADIHRYVKTSEGKIRGLEEALASSKNHASAYFMLVLSLKDEMRVRMNEIEHVSELILNNKIQNDSLQNEMRITEADANNARQSLAERQQHLLLLHSKIQAMSNEVRKSQAEAYYARARQVEETARRTKLAPRKRREAYKEALELYKVARSLGKEEARLDISKIEDKLYGRAAGAQ